MTESKQKGGFRACAFLFVLAFLENIGSATIAASMVVYLTKVMHFDIANSATTFTNFAGSIYFLALFGGFIADTYLNKYYTCLVFGALEVLGLALITIQAFDKDLQPEACGKSSCVSGGKAVMFYGALSLLAIGAGGVKGALSAFGGDQFGRDEKNALASYFNWSLLVSVSGGVTGVTFVVWINLNIAWYLGFFISAMATCIGYIVFALGKPFYQIQRLGNSPLVRIAQVFVVAIRNIRLPLPNNPDELFETKDRSSDNLERISHSAQYRFLDKAAILHQGTMAEQWKVCTITQVEEVKILIRMITIIACTIPMNTCLAQLQTFSVQQGIIMDPHVGSNLKFPAPSIPVLPLAFIAILVMVYEYIFVPFARKLTGHPTGITQLQRVGVGLVLAIISMTIAGGVELYRRMQAIQHPTKPISLFWLCFQFGILGIADMFSLVGLQEFFYREAPSGMRSLFSSFTSLSMALGFYLSTVLVEIINAITKRITPSKQGWLHGNNLNTNNLNLFYWFLAILCFINFVVYLYFASWYKYKKDAPESDITIQAK